MAKLYEFLRFVKNETEKFVVLNKRSRGKPSKRMVKSRKIFKLRLSTGYASIKNSCETELSRYFWPNEAKRSLGFSLSGKAE
jgi:hypothetical protein